VRLRAAEGTARAMLSGLPKNARVQLCVDAKAASFGLRLRATGEKNDGHELRLAPAEGKLWVVGGQSLAGVQWLDKPILLDILLKDNILDICVNGQRTLVNWVPDLRGDRLILFVEKGEAGFDGISVRPLR
ncbi:MAG: hypothetical protein ABSH20_27020, partial [Tepidisphaeraceae bacterium]